jgi:hypothetical protein
MDFILQGKVEEAIRNRLNENKQISKTLLSNAAQATLVLTRDSATDNLPEEILHEIDVQVYNVSVLVPIMMMGPQDHSHLEVDCEHFARVASHAIQAWFNDDPWENTRTLEFINPTTSRS